ncbi:MAG: undecaprenyl-diphosphate phosphatase [Pseudomonadota bacterium]
MPIEHLVFLAIIQGITEFLPISSSGHLALFPALTGAEDQGLALDVAVHVGTLGAVMLYFARDVKSLTIGGMQASVGQFKTDEAQLFLKLLVATIPVIVAGFLIKIFGFVEQMRNIEVIAWAMIIFGIVLYFADQFCACKRSFDSWSWRDSIILGLWQALALIPGTSRSGATLTGARFLGYERVDGARIAMLMSIPTIIAAGGLLGIEVYESGDLTLGLDMLIAAALAFISALLALFGMMRMLERFSMTAFVVYRVALGIFLLWFVNG